jgi:2-dehydro-3-deoxyglucarate aldolase/4-hydroxy-2-oxoheptanedioate aldolase
MTFPERLGEPGPALIGTWLKIPALTTIEIVVTSGLDFVIVDLEHSPMPLDAVQLVCAIAQPYGVSVLARVPDATGREMGRLLDLGVDGVVIPQVRTVDEVAAVLARTRFSGGVRGVGLTSRAGRWGLAPLADYSAQGDQGLLRCIQFETPESVENLSAMLAEEHVNAAFFGAADLSAALGVPVDSPVVEGWAGRLVAAASARGIPCGTAVPTVEAAAVAAERGFRFIAVSNDMTCFAQACSAFVSRARAGVGGVT